MFLTVSHNEIKHIKNAMFKHIVQEKGQQLHLSKTQYTILSNSIFELVVSMAYQHNNPSMQCRKK